MPIQIDRSLAPEVIRLTVTGVSPSAAEVKALYRAEIAAGTMTGSTRGLIDVRGITQLPDLSQIQARADRSTNEMAWPLRRAYVVLPGAQYGVVRQMQAFLPAAIQVQIFTEEGPALAWLLGDDQSA